ncbi:Pre-mRNA-processing factor 40 like protein A [Fukomys damarensis]|uniref:Pre-mRNA-processing factor 40 like protein A n=1 Tax=Fukomys damarensis TaxID=885580 RepID=A0A091EC50_FUKDA|nr:Pre-mRNA-processing factor 40 like protein A [Fukomys damarensis]
MIKAEESSKPEDCSTSTAPVPTTEIPAAAANANASPSTTNIDGTVPVVPEPEVTSIVATIVGNENRVTISTEEQAQLTDTTAVQDLSVEVSRNAEETSKQETVADFTPKKEAEQSQPAKQNKTKKHILGIQRKRQSRHSKNY